MTVIKAIDWHDSTGKTCADCKKWLQWPECPYESFKALHPGPTADAEPCGQFHLNWYRSDEYMKGKPVMQKPSVGRSVHFYRDELEHPCSALVVAVIGEDVNLWIFPRWIGDAEGYIEPKPKFSEQPKPGHWSWPPRV